MVDLKEEKREGESTESADPSFVDYCGVLWRYKCWILSAALLLTVLVGGAIYSQPTCHTMGCHYEIDGTYTQFEILKLYFFSDVNQKRIAQAVGKQGFQGLLDLKQHVFLELKHAVTKRKRFEGDKATPRIWLILRVRYESAEVTEKVMSVCRDNFENYLPLTLEENEIYETIEALKDARAAICNNRYSWQLQLRAKQAALEKLYQLEVAAEWEPFSVFAAQSLEASYFLTSSPVQIAQTGIIALEEKIRCEDDRYVYYQSLIDLHQVFLNELIARGDENYSVCQYQDFLTALLDGYPDETVSGYLRGYLQMIKSQAGARRPVLEVPVSRLTPKSVAQNMVIAFVLALLVSVFSVFVYEGSRSYR